MLPAVFSMREGDEDKTDGPRSVAIRSGDALRRLGSTSAIVSFMAVAPAGS